MAVRDTQVKEPYPKCAQPVDAVSARGATSCVWGWKRPQPIFGGTYIHTTIYREANMAQKRKRTHIMQAEADRETLEYIRRHRPFLNSFSDVYSLAIFELGAKITIEESDKKDRQENEDE